MATEPKSVVLVFAVAASLYLCAALPSAFLLANTRKASPLRFLWAACLTYLAHYFCTVSSEVTTSIVLNNLVLGQGMIGIFQCFNLLLLTSLDDEDLLRAGVYKPSAGFLSKIRSSFALLTNYRGINSPWQTKNVHEFPAFYANHDSRAQPARGWYIVRQSLIISWQYLLLDVMYTSSLDVSPDDNARMFGPGLEFTYSSLTREQSSARLLLGVIVWFVLARTILDITVRVFLLPLVASGILYPDSCPPTFGRIGSAYTIRRFWSPFWHQYLRWPLISLSNFLARDVLRLSRPSVLERYTNIYFVFLGSGIFHLICEIYLGATVSGSRAVMFFSSFAFGIMIEDGVQEIWRRFIADSPKKIRPESQVPPWQKIVGFTWVVLWLLITAPWYLYPTARLPSDIKWMVPFSIIERIGMSTAGIVLAVGGLCLSFAVGVEI